MKYVYRNKNTDGVVELTKPRAEFEESENWERIEGELPDRDVEAEGIEVPDSTADGEDDTLSAQDVVDLVCDNLDAFENGQLEHLQSAIGDQLNSRVTAPSIETAQTESGDPDPDAKNAGGENGGATPPTEIQATDAAEALAKEEGIDLSEVKGTGKDGGITKGDIEAAVKARTEA